MIKLIVSGTPAGLCEGIVFENIYLHYFFKEIMKFILISFALIKVVPWALHVCKVDIEGDYLKFGENSVFFEGITEADFRSYKKYY